MSGAVCRVMFSHRARFLLTRPMTRRREQTLFSRDITTMFTLHATLLTELKGSAAFTSALSSFVPYLKVLLSY